MFPLCTTECRISSPWRSRNFCRCLSTEGRYCINVKNYIFTHNKTLKMHSTKWIVFQGWCIVEINRFYFQTEIDCFVWFSNFAFYQHFINSFVAWSATYLMQDLDLHNNHFVWDRLKTGLCFLVTDKEKFGCYRWDSKIKIMTQISR